MAGARVNPRTTFNQAVDLHIKLTGQNIKNNTPDAGVSKDNYSQSNIAKEIKQFIDDLGADTGLGGADPEIAALKAKLDSIGEQYHGNLIQGLSGSYNDFANEFNALQDDLQNIARRGGVPVGGLQDKVDAISTTGFQSENERVIRELNNAFDRGRASKITTNAIAASSAANIKDLTVAAGKKAVIKNMLNQVSRHVVPLPDAVTNYLFSPSKKTNLFKFDPRDDTQIFKQTHIYEAGNSLPKPVPASLAGGGVASTMPIGDGIYAFGRYTVDVKNGKTKASYRGLEVSRTRSLISFLVKMSMATKDIDLGLWLMMLIEMLIAMLIGKRITKLLDSYHQDFKVFEELRSVEHLAQAMYGAERPDGGKDCNVLEFDHLASDQENWDNLQKDFELVQQLQDDYGITLDYVLGKDFLDKLKDPDFRIKVPSRKPPISKQDYVNEFLAKVRAYNEENKLTREKVADETRQPVLAQQMSDAIANVTAAQNAVNAAPANSLQHDLAQAQLFNAQVNLAQADVNLRTLEVKQANKEVQDANLAIQNATAAFTTNPPGFPAARDALIAAQNKVPLDIAALNAAKINFEATVGAATTQGSVLIDAFNKKTQAVIKLSQAQSNLKQANENQTTIKQQPAQIAVQKAQDKLAKAQTAVVAAAASPALLAAAQKDLAQAKVTLVDADIQQATDLKAQADIAVTKAENELTNASLERLQTQVAAGGVPNQDQRMALDAAEAKEVAARGKLATAQTNLTNATQSLTKAEGILRDLNASQTALTSAKQAHAQSVANRTAAVAPTAAQAADLDAKIATAQQALDKAETKFLETDAALGMRAVEVANDALLGARDRETQAQARLAQAQADHAAIVAPPHTATQKEKEDHRIALAAAKAAVDVADAALTAANDALFAVQNQLTAAHTQHISAQTDFANKLFAQATQAHDDAVGKSPKVVADAELLVKLAQVEKAKVVLAEAEAGIAGAPTVADATNNLNLANQDATAAKLMADAQVAHEQATIKYRTEEDNVADAKASDKPAAEVALAKANVEVNKALVQIEEAKVAVAAAQLARLPTDPILQNFLTTAESNRLDAKVREAQASVAYEEAKLRAGGAVAGTLADAQAQRNIVLARVNVAEASLVKAQADHARISDAASLNALNAAKIDLLNAKVGDAQAQQIIATKIWQEADANRVAAPTANAVQKVNEAQVKLDEAKVAVKYIELERVKEMHVQALAKDPLDPAYLHNLDTAQSDLFQGLVELQEAKRDQANVLFAQGIPDRITADTVARAAGQALKDAQSLQRGANTILPSAVIRAQNNFTTQQVHAKTALTNIHGAFTPVLGAGDQPSDITPQTQVLADFIQSQVDAKAQELEQSEVELGLAQAVAAGNPDPAIQQTLTNAQTKQQDAKRVADEAGSLKDKFQELVNFQDKATRELGDAGTEVKRANDQITILNASPPDLLARANARLGVANGEKLLAQAQTALAYSNREQAKILQTLTTVAGGDVAQIQNAKDALTGARNQYSVVQGREEGFDRKVQEMAGLQRDAEKVVREYNAAELKFQVLRDPTKNPDLASPSLLIRLTAYLEIAKANINFQDRREAKAGQEQVQAKSEGNKAWEAAAKIDESTASTNKSKAENTVKSLEAQIAEVQRVLGEAKTEFSNLKTDFPDLKPDQPDFIENAVAVFSKEVTQAVAEDKGIPADKKTKLDEFKASIEKALKALPADHPAQISSKDSFDKEVKVASAPSASMGGGGS